ncbi:LOW QUALITY PROTEIN: ADP-ribosylation factor-like protein 4D [Callorhinchus milii]|uniref:LOW QUALITY PROTEIN: ADP-ribosylation factor-like protein 4D n=1 Tax=Callorhinchus milii TaxID=7868 RepID=UPI001C3F86D7|nr:LOW QUALITY PROTEIN: ADP-ribosylation factor-like protein 4D [Callorhinchus milii]
MGNQLTPSGTFLPPFQTLHVVVIGLDCAGKTALLYRLKLREFVETIPTKGFNTEKVRVQLDGGGGASGVPKAVTFQVWDVGGQDKLRPLWRSYTRRTDGIVFVVDCAESERLEEARVELHKISRMAENQGVPVLVLANKQDLPGAATAGDTERALGLHEPGSPVPYHVQSSSAVSGHGLQQGLERLYHMIAKRQKLLRHQKRKR